MSNLGCSRCPWAGEHVTALLAHWETGHGGIPMPRIIDAPSQPRSRKRAGSALADLLLFSPCKRPLTQLDVQTLADLAGMAVTSVQDRISAYAVAR